MFNVRAARGSDFKTSLTILLNARKIGKMVGRKVSGLYRTESQPKQGTKLTDQVAYSSALSFSTFMKIDIDVRTTATHGCDNEVFKI